MNMRNVIRAKGALALIAASALLVGCQGTSELLGFSKSSPDEFAVVTKAPLVLPPDYALRPPQPGTSRPQEATPSQQVSNELTGAGSRSANVSGTLTPGEMALLQDAGATQVDPGIRARVDAESDELARKDDSFVDSLLFWQEKVPPGTVVNPTQEKRRLRANAAEGKAVTEGETPSIERRKRAIFEGIFE